MDDHTGRIDHPTELRLNLGFDLLLKEGIKALEREEFVLYAGEFFLTEKLLPQLSQGLPYSLDHYVSRIGL